MIKVTQNILQNVIATVSQTAAVRTRKEELDTQDICVPFSDRNALEGSCLTPKATSGNHGGCS